jgi:ubiquitin-conjugating enzyme E2 G1
MKFPSDYPNNPPEFRFLTPMWHPNSWIIEFDGIVYPDGRVCVSILHAQSEEFNEHEPPETRYQLLQSSPKVATNPVPRGRVDIDHFDAERAQHQFSSECGRKCAVPR